MVSAPCIPIASPCRQADSWQVGAIDGVGGCCSGGGVSIPRAMSAIPRKTLGKEVASRAQPSKQCLEEVELQCTGYL